MRAAASLRRPLDPFAAATQPGGCTCTPLYHVVLVTAASSSASRSGTTARRRSGRSTRAEARSPAARYRVLEDIALRRVGRAVARRLHRQGELPPRLRATLDYAKSVFGGAKVRDLTAGDVRRLLDHIREEDAAVAPVEGRSRAQGESRRRRSRSTCASSAPASRPRSPRATPSGTRCASCTRRRGRRSRSRGPPTTPTRSSRGSGRSSPTGPSMLASARRPSLTGLRFGELAALDGPTSTCSTASCRSRRTSRRGSAIGCRSRASRARST